VASFHREAVQGNKNGTEDPPTSLKQCIQSGVHFVILSLVNECQCDSVCFGEDDCLINLLAEGSCVILTSTVTGMSNIAGKYNYSYVSVFWNK
jgi:3-hydroxyisobutyrate dehydrogenase-like beta-hydroxyacid dehydrogenase